MSFNFISNQVASMGDLRWPFLSIIRHQRFRGGQKFEFANLHLGRMDWLDSINISFQCNEVGVIDENNKKKFSVSTKTSATYAPRVQVLSTHL